MCASLGWTPFICLGRGPWNMFTFDDVNSIQAPSCRSCVVPRTTASTLLHVIHRLNNVFLRQLAYVTIFLGP